MLYFYKKKKCFNELGMNKYRGWFFLFNLYTNIYIYILSTKIINNIIYMLIKLNLLVLYTNIYYVFT